MQSGTQRIRHMQLTIGSNPYKSYIFVSPEILAHEITQSPRCQRQKEIGHLFLLKNMTKT